MPDESPADGARPGPKRRRLTIGLSMILLALLALPMAWVKNRGRDEQRAITSIQRAGGIAVRGLRRAPTGDIRFDGHGPAPWGIFRYLPDANLRPVTYVGFRRGRVDDALLEQLVCLSGLEELDLSASLVSDAGLAHLRGCKNLKRLELVGTQITEAGLIEIGALESLEWLNLAGAPITDDGLAHLSGLRKLRVLNLERTIIGNVGLVHLEGMDQLEKLALGGTRVTNAGMVHLKSHRRLISVTLPANRISAAKIEELERSLPQLQDREFHY